jgi:hypothetical protein
MQASSLDITNAVQGQSPYDSQQYGLNLWEPGSAEERRGTIDCARQEKPAIDQPRRPDPRLLCDVFGVIRVAHDPSGATYDQIIESPKQPVEQQLARAAHVVSSVDKTFRCSHHLACTPGGPHRRRHRSISLSDAASSSSAASPFSFVVFGDYPLRHLRASNCSYRNVRAKLARPRQ